MSRLSRTVNVSLRSSICPLKGSVLAPPRTQPVRKRDIHIKARGKHALQGSIKTTAVLHWRQRHTAASIDAGPSDKSPENRLSSHKIQESELNVDDDARFAAHLNSVFPCLEFPPELAKRILTHGSHKTAIHGHNGRLAFVGRRVLESYYLLFVHEASQARARDYELLASRALNTYLLGEHVAPLWSLGRVLRWVPTVPQETLKAVQQNTPDAELDHALRSNPGVVKSVGLYKVMGEAVQAVVGGVYHQFGGSVAHRFFHTRVLPHILLPGSTSGVPLELHGRAWSICHAMGGKDGTLILRPSPPDMIETPEFVEMKPKRRIAAVGR